MSDNVEHPSHYNAGGVETIEGIKAALGDGFSDYCLGNVLKYVWRCKHKGKLLEDLRKAAKYLEWAIEAAEGDCPETPDSSSGKAIPIPEGWRELEPDEVPLATDMHEWMGGWVVRSIDSGQPYKWHDRRNIRKIETPKPEPLAIPEGWRELEENEPLSEGDLFDLDGEWVGHEYDPSGGVYSSRIHRRHIRKIETANPSDSLTGKQGYFDDADGVWVDETNPFDGRKIETPKPEPLAIPEGWRELEEDEPLSEDDLYELNGEWTAFKHDPLGDRYSSRIHRRHIRKIETANTSETSNSSIPDPGPGYRLLSKEPPEQVITGDEFWQNLNREWVESENFIHEGGPQAPELYYRRKIEPAVWIPKVGDKVRVVGGFMNPIGEVGIVKDFCPVVNGNFSILIHEGRCTLGWFKKDDVELIEAAS